MSEAKSATAADWPIFSLHLKRTLLPLLVGCFGVYFTYAAVVLLYVHGSPKSMREALDFPAIALIVVLAVPVGTAAFSRAFKEQHIVFLHAMPISRARQWMLLVASGAAALLITTAAFFVVRPSLLQTMADGASAATFLGVIALLFAAGTCFGIVVRHPVAVYAGAFIALLLSFNLAAFIEAAPRLAYNGDVPFTVAMLRGNPESAYAYVSPQMMVVVAALFTVAFLAISLRTYIRGEVTLLRTQARNVAIVAVTLLLIASAGVVVTNAVMLRAAPSRIDGYRVSASGRFVMQRTSRIGFEWRGRVRIADLVRGALASDRATDGVFSSRWIGDRLILMRHDIPGLRRLGLLRAQRDAAEVYSPEGALVGRYSREGVIKQAVYDEADSFDQADYARLAYVSRDTATVVDIGGDGRGRELVSAPAADVRVSSSLAYFQLTGKSHVFRIDGPARELPWYPAAVEREFPVVFRDVVYPDVKTFVTVIGRDFPIAHAEGETVAYAVNVGTLEALDTMYAIVPHRNGQGTMLALPPGANQWSVICGDMKMPQHVTRDPSVWELFGGVVIAVARGNHFAACTDEGLGRSTVRFYDPTRRASMAVMTVSEPPLLIITHRLLFVDRTHSIGDHRPLGTFRYDGKGLTAVDRVALDHGVRISDGSKRDAADAVVRGADGKTRVAYTFENR